ARMSPVVSISRAFGPEPEFLDKLDESGCRYVAEVLDSFEVFIKEPVLIHAGLRTRRRGRPRKPSFVLDSDKVPVRVSSVGICPLEKDPLQPASQTEDVPETQVLPSHTKVWPAPGWRDGIVHKPVWLAGMQGIHPAETSFAVSNVPEDLLAGELAMSQRAQDIAQRCKRVMRHELGLAHHEGRSWDGWHRHVVLVFLAWGFILERRRSAWMQPLSPVLT
ncbi:MAG TPA: hypothetical protein PLM29_08900, partial [Deltaproteobacteria bacterium]|nr:hypothetical protein [Deltaproteobacteria bacterium]